MRFSLIEQETNDIDWFFVDMNNEIGFVASGGGRLPNSIADNKYNLSSYFRNLSNISDYKLNNDLLKIGETETLKQYFDFILLAKKGLYCFDKIDLNNFDDTRYNLIVKPVRGLKVDEIPSNILKILNITKLKLELNKIKELDVNLID
ncbi:hypothetical protein [Aquimarina macrocephali]|uniref:hypothetical protein n=1 Tax=Aquimarina macrocephali TaxID=666563 RepID=UPI003F678A7C